MNSPPRQQAVRRHRLFFGILACLALTISGGHAQEQRDRPPPSAPGGEAPGAGGLGARRAPAARPDREGTPEGMPEGAPQARVAPPGEQGRPSLLPRRWMLGVHAYNTSTGVVVTRVLPRSPAAQVGLEPNDMIVTVNGFQIGEVNGQLYLLGDELQHRGGATGRVRLLVQNWRDNQLMNLDVRLQRDLDFPRPFPRERE